MPTPTPQVVAAALASFPWTYLEAINKAGAAKSMDVVAVNPFTVYPWSVIRGERKVREGHAQVGPAPQAALDHRGHLARVQGQGPGRTRASWQKQWETGPVGMAKRLREVYKLLVARRRHDRIGRVYWYTWATDYAGDDLFDYSGLLRWDGSTFFGTPALRAYTASARLDEGCRKTSAGRCR